MSFCNPQKLPFRTILIQKETKEGIRKEILKPKVVMAGYAFIARRLHTLANSLASPAENPRPWIPTRGSDPNVEVTATLPDWATGSFDGAGLNQGQKMLCPMVPLPVYGRQLPHKPVDLSQRKVVDRRFGKLLAEIQLNWTRRVSVVESNDVDSSDESRFRNERSTSLVDKL